MTYKTDRHHLFCLRKLFYFHVDKSIMTLFKKKKRVIIALKKKKKGVIGSESVLTSSLMCWYGNLNIKAKKKKKKCTQQNSEVKYWDLCKVWCLSFSLDR